MERPAKKPRQSLEGLGGVRTHPSRYLRTIGSSRSFGLLGFTAGYLGVWTTTGWCRVLHTGHRRPVDTWARCWRHSSSQWNAYAEFVILEVYHVVHALGCQ